ncbi:MAG: amidohydrolase family protein [Chthoniobacter sp.]|nr:amidohydrolase family protein [Chthoniobacter sp.]
MILRARAIVTMDGPPIENGAVAIEGNRIIAVGRSEDVAVPAGETVLDLGEVALLPGLINAHCHLDYSMMRNAISRPKSFTAWVQRINALKRSLDNDDYLAAIRRGFAELRKWGTTSVCNIEAFPELMPHLAPSPLRTWWFYEMIDIRHRITSDDVVAGALAFFQHRENSLDSSGLSPHAPYTASLALYQLANTCGDAFAMPLTTHVAESREEFAMFRDAAGPLHDFMSALQRPMGDCGRTTPFAHLWQSGAINGRWLLAHMNELTDDDFALLASVPRDSLPSIVHCPGSLRYFQHTPFPYRRLHDLGVNLCLGTDSLASTRTLSLFEELRSLAKTDPWLTPEQLLRTVTVHPARALRRRGQLGQITPGALADLIALPASGDLATVYEEVIQHDQPIAWTMIDGQVLA